MKDIFNLDVLFGFLIGFALCLVLMLLPWTQKTGIAHYQELISGVLALLGAAAAVAVVNRQIQHAQQMEDERRDRDFYAARSLAAHALDDVCSYARKLSSLYRELLPRGEAAGQVNQFSISEKSLPRIFPETIQRLESLIKLGGPSLQQRVHALLTTLQTHGAGLNHHASSYDRILDVLEVHARASRLFPYTRRPERRETKVPDEPNLTDFIVSMAECGFNDEPWDAEVWERLQEKWPPGIPVWEEC